MDNLKGKTIKQFYFNTEYGTIIITAIQNNAGFTEFLGHVAGYGLIHFLTGYEVRKSESLRKCAKDVMCDFFDEFMEEQEQEIAEYMGENYNKDEGMHEVIKKLNKSFSDNMARVAQKETKCQH